MDVREFSFDLPSELIAQDPPAVRGSSRLLHLDRRTGARSHTTVDAVAQFLEPGDVLVANNTRVFPARLLGRRVPSGGAVECLLIRRIGSDPGRGASGSACELWEALMHPGQKLKPGAEVVFDGRPALRAEVLERRFYGRRLIRLFTDDGSEIGAAVDRIGHVPLPPYINRQADAAERDRYQTMFARERGSVAAPTAGLHFTPALLGALGQCVVELAEITLHVGYGTFQPVRVERGDDHR